MARASLEVPQWHVYMAPRWHIATSKVSLLYLKRPLLCLGLIVFWDGLLSGMDSHGTDKVF